jgi:CDP-diacylglycerol--serine O-phosphatidyltransferase
MWATRGDFRLALLFIVIGAVFDFFDGMSARLLHVSSPIGKELDSLADVVTFGVAPSFMLSSWMKEACIYEWLFLLPMLMAAFSALRLAKFNLDERQAMGFIGLPTPANALFWASLIATWGHELAIFPSILPITLVMMLLSCYLLVSEIPMFALKFKTWGWKGNEVKWGFLLSCIPLVIFFGTGSLAIIIAWYVVLSVVTHNIHGQEKSQPEP